MLFPGKDGILRAEIAERGRAVEYCCEVCGLKLLLSLPEGVRPVGAIEPFLLERAGFQPQVRYAARWYTQRPADTGPVVESQVGYSIRRMGRGYRYAFNVGCTLNPDALLLDQDPETQSYDLWLPRAHEALLRREGLPIAQNLGQELLLLSHDRLLLHASLIRWGGKAVLFTGPSGMGKSTQASLWERYRGAEILNGDKTVLHLTPERITAWGSPYAGTSGIYRNEAAPAAGIVALRQGPVNEIVPLRGKEALLELMPRMATAPWAGQWHGRGVDLALALLERIPVYRLTCRPDREAVELTERTIFPDGRGAALPARGKMGGIGI